MIDSHTPRGDVTAKKEEALAALLDETNYGRDMSLPKSGYDVCGCLISMHRHGSEF